MDAKKDSPTTIDEYIAQYPEDIQKILIKMRGAIREAAPEAEEKISYKMPAFYLKGNLVYFGVQKQHIGFYPTPSGIEAFKEELTGYKWAKGSVQFPLDGPMPYDLIRRIVQFRLNEVRQKK